MASSIIYRLVLLASLLGASAAIAVPTPYTLVYSGNVDGELEPCGCTQEGNLGGIMRQATLVDRLRKERPDLFLISSGGLLSGFAAHGQLTNEYILKGVEVMGYDAIGVQWADLSYGPAFLKAHALPWVASNWLNQDFLPRQRIKRGGHELAFFAWLDPEGSPQHAMQGNHAVVRERSDELTQALRSTKQEGALVVLSTTLTLEEAVRSLPLENVDVLLIHAKYQDFGVPQLRGHTLVLQPGSRGMRLGRVDLTLDDKGLIQTWKDEVMPMPPSVPDAERLQAWYQAYNARIKEDYRRTSALRKAEQTGDTPYVGDEACKSCHATAYETWNKSRHAEAYAALENVHKSFDPDCLRCHTVGFNAPGGYIDMDVTMNLTNVQCESCHGAARAHVTSSGKTPTPNSAWQAPQMCAQCHTQPHSPSFNFAIYWPRIAH